VGAKFKTMKFSSNSNGHSAIGPRPGTSASNQSDHHSDAAYVPEKSGMRPKGSIHILALSEEQAFRKFILSRLPEVKAPESLKQKIRSSIKNYRP